MVQDYRLWAESVEVGLVLGFIIKNLKEGA